MVDRLRAAARPAPTAAASSPASSAAGVRRQPAQPGHAQRRGLADRPGHLVGAGARSPGPQPGDPRRPARAARCRWPAPAPAGRSASSSSAIRRLSAWASAASSGASAFHALPAGSRVPTRPGIRGVCQPGPHQRRPSARRRAGRPTRRRRRWAPRPGCRRRRTAVGEQPGRGASLDDQRGRRPRRRAACAAVALRSRTASPPLRSAPGGSGAPVVEQQLHAAYRLERGARGGPVDQRGVARRRWRPRAGRRRGSRVVRPPRRASPTSPGSTTTPPPRGTSSLRASSSSAGVAASSGSTVCRAVPVVASPPLVGDVLEQGPGRLGAARRARAPPRRGPAGRARPAQAAEPAALGRR